MINQERTGQRGGSLDYSRWHRTLPDHCYFTDLDAVEIRLGRGIVAFMEILRCRKIEGNEMGRLNEAFWRKALQLSQFKQDVIKALARAVPCDAYLVAHDDDLEQFWVLDLLRPGPRRNYNRQEYQHFLECL